MGTFGAPCEESPPVKERDPSCTHHLRTMQKYYQENGWKYQECIRNSQKFRIQQAI